MPLGPLTEEIHKAAADRLEELQLELTETREELDCAQAEIKRAHTKADKAYALRKEAEIERDSLRDTMALNILEMTQQRDEARAEVERLRGASCTCAPTQRLVTENAECHAEVERVKKALHDAERDTVDIKLLDETRAEVESLKQSLQKSSDNNMDLIQRLAETFIELDKARDEILKLKVETEAPTVNQQLTVRPKPSRLEIAAMVAPAVCHLGCGADLDARDFSEACVQVADALIAAAKEGK